jgi:hypothetical protein
VQAIRDFVHNHIAFCCCMNIHGRYCTGYLGDTSLAAGDFCRLVLGLHRRSLVHVGSRNNIPRIGRVLIAQGRDAAEFQSFQTFEPNTVSFTV